MKKSGDDLDIDLSRIEKEIESKFGPVFEKKMEALGKELEARLGPGSEFAKRMEAQGKELEAKFGPDSEFAKKLKGKAAARSSDSTQDKKEFSSSRDLVKPQLNTTVKPGSRRERRIKELEARIRKLMDEIKSLEESDDQDNNEA